jgi:hypothetical protein
MPLSPLPETNTKRYFLVYTAAGLTHQLQARCADTVGDSTALTFLSDIATALAPSAGTNTTFAGVEVAANGSNVRNIVPGFTPIAGTGGGAVGGAEIVKSWCISGRAPSGRKVKVFVFGMFLSTPANYKQDPLTDAALQGFQGLLNSQTDFWLAIDGTKPVWYFRATTKPNDHWVDFERT